MIRLELARISFPYLDEGFGFLAAMLLAGQTAISRYVHDELVLDHERYDSAKHKMEA